MSSSEEYSTYDIELPSKFLTTVFKYIGWVVALIGFGMSLFSAKKLLDKYLADIDSFSCTLGGRDCLSESWFASYWYLSILTFFCGIALAVYSHRKYTTYFRRVHQGQVIKKDTFGGGDWPLEWSVLIEGNTLSNELARSWKRISAGTWHELNRGDWVDFR